jgi:hypothetical protein
VLQGDIDNSISQRVLVLWEDTVGILIDPRREKTALRVRRWKQAVDCWETNQYAMGRIWDIYRRQSLRCDLVVTERPPEFAEALAKRLEDENSPFRQVLSQEAHVLARKLAFMPDVVYVIFSNRSQSFTFGSKGLHMDHTGRTSVL